MKPLRTLALLACLTCTLHAAEPIVVKLWPSGAPEAPGFKADGGEKELPKKNENDVKRITNINDPTITVFKPEKPNGTAVIVAPGGGYGILASEHEGTQVCD